MFNNRSNYKFTDISSEISRVYTFPGGEKVVINEPMQLAISNNGHRIFDSEENCHYVPKGWIHLTWNVKIGQPHFVL